MYRYERQTKHNGLLPTPRLCMKWGAKFEDSDIFWIINCIEMFHKNWKCFKVYTYLLWCEALSSSFKSQMTLHGKNQGSNISRVSSQVSHHLQKYWLNTSTWCEALSCSSEIQVALQGKIQGSNISYGTCYVFDYLQKYWLDTSLWDISCFSYVNYGVQKGHFFLKLPYAVLRWNLVEYFLKISFFKK